MCLGKEGGPISKAHGELGRLSESCFGVVPIGRKEARLFRHLHTHNPAFLRMFPQKERMIIPKHTQDSLCTKQIRFHPPEGSPTTPQASRLNSPSMAAEHEQCKWV